MITERIHRIEETDITTKFGSFIFHRTIKFLGIPIFKQYKTSKFILKKESEREFGFNKKH